MLNENNTQKNMIRLLILFPVLLLAFSSIQILPPRSAGVHLDKPLEFIPYYLKPSQQGVGELLNLLWMIWPGLFFCLSKREVFEGKQHLIYQAYPYILFIMHYAFLNLIGKGLAPFYYLDFLPALELFLSGLLVGYILLLFLVIYLKIWEKVKNKSFNKEDSSNRARSILVFIVFITILVFVAIYLINFYIRKTVIGFDGKSIEELPRNWDIRLRQLRYIGQSLQNTGENLLALWPSLVIFMIWIRGIKRHKLALILYPLLFVFVHEILARLAFSLLDLTRGFELFYFLLLKPVIRGYIIGFALLLYLLKIAKGGEKVLPQ